MSIATKLNIFKLLNEKRPIFYHKLIGLLDFVAGHSKLSATLLVITMLKKLNFVLIIVILIILIIGAMLIQILIFLSGTETAYRRCPVYTPL